MDGWSDNGHAVCHSLTATDYDETCIHFVGIIQICVYKCVLQMCTTNM